MNENKIIHNLLEIFEYKSEYQRQTSNIQPQDMYVLERIYFNKKLTIKDISKKYSIPPSTLTGIIDRLENKKLIKRFRTNADRRTIELVTTPEGSAIVEKHLEEDELFSTNFFNSLTETKKKNSKSCLKSCCRILKRIVCFHKTNNYRRG